MEKSILLKKKLTNTAFMAAGAILVAGLLYFYLSSETEETGRYAKQLENEVLSLKRQSEDTRNKNEILARAVRVYYNLPVEQKDTPNLEETASRIRTARPIIDELRIRYKFSSLNANFSKVEEVTESFKTKNIRVYKNSIDIDFKALTDEIVFSFMDALIKQMPGYITIDAITMNKESDITPAVIKALLVRQPNIPFLVSGKIKLTWWSISAVKSENKNAP